MSTAESLNATCAEDPENCGFCDIDLIECHLVGTDMKENPSLVARCQRCAGVIIKTVADPRTYWKLMASGVEETIIHLEPMAKILRLPLGQAEDPELKE